MPKFAPELLPHEVRDLFKYEIASGLGLADQVLERGWSETTSRDCGRVGGRIGGPMVRVLIRRAEEALARGVAPGP